MSLSATFIRTPYAISCAALSADWGGSDVAKWEQDKMLERHFAAIHEYLKDVEGSFIEVTTKFKPLDADYSFDGKRAEWRSVVVTEHLEGDIA